MRSYNGVASAAGGTKERIDSLSLASTALEPCSSAERMQTVEQSRDRGCTPARWVGGSQPLLPTFPGQLSGK